MSAAIDVEQRALTATLRKVFGNLCPPGLLDEVESGRAPTTTAARWQTLTEMGLPGLTAGDGEAVATGHALACAAHEVGRVLLPDPLLAVWDALDVLSFGGEDAAALAAAADAGRARPVLAVTGRDGGWTADQVDVTVSGGALHGSAHLVEAADVATHLVVAARTGTGVELFIVEAGAPGVRATAADAIVGHHWWDVAFDGVLPAGSGGSWAGVEAALPGMWARLTAWCAGASERILADTVAYASTRVQFGRPIGSFQAVQHNLADAAIAAREATNLAGAAAARLDGQDADAALVCAAAALRATEAMVEVTRRCHQTWGGIGFCTETDVHHFSRRAKLAEQSRGTQRLRHEVIARELAAGGRARRTARLDSDDAVERFRAEVRTFLAEHADPAIPAQGSFPQGDTPEKKRFIAALASRGWLGLGWPPEYGGSGLDPRFQLVLQQELEYEAMPTASIEVAMIGPTLLRHGSAHLKSTYLPRITAGTVSFALGYSEPGAGSDLAALSTTAVRRGDHYVVNGQKMYTSAAHFADAIWLACRTDPQASPHRGISLLLLDSATPGITVTELRTMGSHRTNVVFLDDVVVPAHCLVGEENHGWTYLMEALDLERLTGFPTGGFLRDADLLVEWCTREGMWADPRVRDLVTAVCVRTLAAISHFDAAMDVLSAGRIPTTEATMLKVAVTEARQQHADEVLRLLGPRALRRGGPGSLLDGHFELVWRDEIITTIAGGANEIQRNILAQRLLGLPRG